MKIFFDTEIFGMQKRGGASNYWLEFMKRFLKEFNPTFFVFKDDKYLNKEFVLFKNNTIKNVINDRNYSPSLLRLINPPRIKMNENTIFHSTLYRYLKNKKVKNIVTIHDFTHQVYGSFFHKFANTFLKKRALKHADGIVCISKNTYNDLLKFYPKAINKKVAIIYNGFSHECFYKIDNLILPEKYKVLNNKKFILFVGQRDGYKNFDFIIKVLREKEDIYLALVGGKDFDNTQYDDINERIIHFNNVNDQELNILYNKCFAFIYPSLYEGFGIPIAEAMNAGCPVIAFNNSSIPEVMNGAGILLENNDLVGTIKSLNDLDNEEYRKEIIEKQFKACKVFSWDNAYEQMKDFYYKVLNND